MKRYLRMFIILFIIMTIADIIKYEIGLWAKTAFYGVSILFYAVFQFNNIVNGIEIDKKYHKSEVLKEYNRKTATSLLWMGIATLVTAVILYFDDSVYWLLVLLPFIFLILIYGRQEDRKFWMQIPNEDRPRKYQDK